MSDQYISKQELVRILNDAGSNYMFFSDNSMGYTDGPEEQIEKYLSRYIDEKITKGVKDVLYQLASEIELAPSSELCLLCKDANPSEGEQN